MINSSNNNGLKEVLIFLFIFIQASTVSAQNNSGIFVGAGVAAAALLSDNQIVAMKSYAEHKALEWYLDEYDIPDGARIKVNCLNLQGNKWNDISSSNSVVVRFEEYSSGVILYGHNDKPLIRQVIFVLSDGWWNSYGVEFTRVKPIVIDESNVEELLIGMLNLMGNSKAIAYSKDSIVFYDFEIIKSIDGEASTIRKPKAVLRTDNIVGDFSHSDGIDFKSDDNKHYHLGIVNGWGYTFWDLPKLRVKLTINTNGTGFYVEETQDLIILKNEVITEILKVYSPLKDI